ncbi:MAG: hydrogenase expression/formation protein [Pseudomonadota bacterium]
MSINFTMPPVGFGPGSQPTNEDGAELSYMPMPSGMRAFESRLPEVDDPETIRPLLTLLLEAAEACERTAADGEIRRFDLGALDATNRRVLAETLGEGEVAAIVEGAESPKIEAQESVFAGLWRVREGDQEHLEIGAAPAAVTARSGGSFHAVAAIPGVVNAPAVITELAEAASIRQPGGPAHVVNLTLLPHTPEDLVHLDAALGRGPVTILSRGYGNCRIEQASRADLWRVRFYNSQDALILDTIEVCEIPEVAIAAKEDLSDSAERLREVVEALS